MERRVKNHFKIFHLFETFVLMLASCEKNATYRHVPYLIKQTKNIFVDRNGNKYFDLFNESGYYVYDDLQEKRFKTIHFFDNDVRAYYKCSASNSDYLFVALSSFDQYTYPLIQIYDALFVLQKTIYCKSNTEITGIVCDDNYLYFLERIKDSTVKSLVKYNIKTNEQSVLATFSETSVSFESDGTHLYCYGYSLMKDESKTTLAYKSVDNQRIWFFKDKEIRLFNNNIEITNDGTKYVFKNNYGFNNLYQKKYLINSKLIFAAYRDVKNDECGSLANTNSKCICGMKESYLFSFDVENNQLQLIESYPVGTFLIDYDNQGAEYYYDGGLYVNGVLLRDCEEIGPGELVKVSNLYQFRESETKEFVISYINGDFYGI